MKVVSFNVNGIRSRVHQLRAVRDAHDPDVIGVQETKVVDGDFPGEAISELGYVAHFFGQKTHYGVALLSKRDPAALSRGYPFDGEGAQRRLITGVWDLPSGERVTVVNGYFPQGESRDHPVKFPGKRAFYGDMLRYLRESFRPDENLVVLGDMNVAPRDADVGIGSDNAKRWLRTGKCSFLPEEREWLQALADWGLFDSFRTCHAEAGDVFSWFDYRSRGFERDPRRGLRIDFVLSTEPMNRRCVAAGVDYAIRGMERPSDHCPVWAEFEV
jgi:exodeoxyribonuclease-3